MHTQAGATWREFGPEDERLVVVAAVLVAVGDRLGPSDGGDPSAHQCGGGLVAVGVDPVESDLPVDRIAADAGFGTTASLRQHLLVSVGVSRGS